MNKQQQTFANVFYAVGSVIMMLSGIITGNYLTTVGAMFFLIGTNIMLFGDES